MTVITAVVGTATYLAKQIESKYQDEVKALREGMIELEKETKLCQQDRYALAVRVASLEAVTKQNASDIRTNTTDIRTNTQDLKERPQ